MNGSALGLKKLFPSTSIPIMYAKIPPQIMKEIDVWIKECRKIKNHPLAPLKAHENVGYRAHDGKIHNSYQCSIPTHLIENSFWLAWVIRLTSQHWGGLKSHRSYSLRKWAGHFDGYDMWTNFSYKGDDNPTHNHAGSFSGVIYYKNHKHPTLFDEYNVGYEGTDGTMVMFPSKTLHHVDPQIVNKERITLAFNIIDDSVPEKHKVRAGV